jgi:zinc transporter ZupT
MIWTIFWLILAVVAGGLFVSFFDKHRKNFIKLMLAFSGGFLLSIAFIHFIPELYGHGGENIGLFILIGFLVQLILEFFSGGIEHGHIHVHSNQKMPIALLISLSIHSFIEGVPLGAGEMAHHGHGHDHGENGLLLGIIFHQFPVAIALMTLFLKSNMEIVKAWLLLLLFSIMTPAGVIFGNLWFSQGTTIDFSMIMAVVVGMFLHISTTIIFETSENHKFNIIKLSAIVIGVVMALGIH